MRPWPSAAAERIKKSNSAMVEVHDIFKTIDTLAKKDGSPAYVVGGFVRDFLLGKAQDRDLDFVVVGSGLTFAKRFDTAFIGKGRLVEFPDFDTARYLIGEEDEQIVLEFAGARSEMYAPNSRKPKVVSATLEQDLSRRDFTVNAMAAPLKLFSTKREPSLSKVKKSVIDPFNGQNDLENKILKTPLNPTATFTDDPLRMLRAIRLAAQLNFAIDPSTLDSIYKNRERLKIISVERVQAELLKLLATPEPSIGLILLFQTHLLDIILPEVAKLDGVEEIFGHQHKNNLVHSFKVVDNIAQYSSSTWLRLAGLLHDIGKPGTKHFMPRVGWTFHAHEHLGKNMVQTIGKRLRFSTEHTAYLAKLIRWHMQPISLMDEGITDSAVRRLVVTMGEELDDLLILGRSDITTGNPYKKAKRLKNYDRLKQKIEEVLARDKLRAFQSPVRGEEIMQVCKLKPGPTVGKIKEAIEEAILDGKIPNEYEAAKEYFEKIKPEYLAKAAAWEHVSRI